LECSVFILILVLVENAWNTLGGGIAKMYTPEYVVVRHCLLNMQNLNGWNDSWNFSKLT